MKDLISYDFVKELYADKLFKFFTAVNDINLWAIRGKERAVNKFDDIIGVSFINEQGEPVCAFYNGTVDPGIEWLTTPMNPGGAAAIAPGQYRRVWQMGTFKGTRALIQIGNFRIYRDNDKNSTFNYKPASIMNSPFTDGIFLHEHFQGKEVANTVGRSSAGCVVLQSRNEHNSLMDYLQKQINRGLGNRFTFTLFEE